MNAQPQDPAPQEQPQPAPKQDNPDATAQPQPAPKQENPDAAAQSETEAPAGYTKKSSIVKEGLAEAETLEIDRELSVKFANLGDLHLSSNKIKEAKEYYRKALAVSEDLYQRMPDHTLLVSDLAVVLEKMGDISRKQGEQEHARDYYERSLSLCEELYRKAPSRPEFVKYLAVSHYKIAAFYESIRDRDAASRHKELCYKAITLMKGRGMYVDAQLDKLWQFLDKNKGKI